MSVAVQFFEGNVRVDAWLAAQQVPGVGSGVLLGREVQRFSVLDVVWIGPGLVRVCVEIAENAHGENAAGTVRRNAPPRLLGDR